MDTIKLKITVIVRNGNKSHEVTTYVDTGKTRADKGRMTLPQWTEHLCSVKAAWELTNVSILSEECR